MQSAEFQIIERYFAARARAAYDSDADLELGIGDDCALLRVPHDSELAVSVDTLVAGVHYPPETDPVDVGHKALAVGLSDLAAMGAEPRWMTLALTLPEVDETWLAGFGRGFFALAERYGVRLVGGDTTRGPESITVQVHGTVPPGRALRRSLACPGDLVYVTGELGGAGLALLARQGKVSLPAEHATRALERLNCPEPRIREGLALRGIAHAAIDISDGLAADLGHILKASGVGATLQLERLPLAPGLTVYETLDWNLPLCAGDDYELCFTSPPGNQIRLLEVLERFSCRCTCIGAIENVPGLRCRLANGELFVTDTRGYEHFA